MPLFYLSTQDRQGPYRSPNTQHSVSRFHMKIPPPHPPLPPPPPKKCLPFRTLKIHPGSDKPAGSPAECWTDPLILSRPDMTFELTGC